MIGWSIITIICIALFIFFVYKTRRAGIFGWDGWWLGSMITGSVGFILALLVIFSSLDYQKFETSFEITRSFYDRIDNPNEVVLVVDVLEANQKLADYQASNLRYGIFSFAPDRVHDIVPIGVRQPDL